MGSDNAEWFRRRMMDALELRWKKREKICEVFCGPEDIEYVESGATVYATEEDYAQLEARQKRADAVFSKTATAITPQLNGLDLDGVIAALRQIQFQLKGRIFESKGIESARKAKTDLRKLSENAYELATTMLDLGEGALETLDRTYVRIGES